MPTLDELVEKRRQEQPFGSYEEFLALFEGDPADDDLPSAEEMLED